MEDSIFIHANSGRTKIDTEGFELDVLRGMQGVLRTQQLRTLGIGSFQPAGRAQHKGRAAGDRTPPDQRRLSLCLAGLVASSGHPAHSMKRVILPGTDLSISRLSFGTASLHYLLTTAKRQSLLAAAIDYDFRHFDTAPSYGFGISEWELGKFLRTCPTKVTVASKVGLYPPTGRTQSTISVWLRKGLGKLLPVLSAELMDWSLARAEKSLTQTLRTLGRDCLDILFLHEPLQLSKLSASQAVNPPVRSVDAVGSQAYAG